MPIDVVVEIAIDRPRSTVAAYAADPDNAMEWYANIESVKWKSPRPLTVGSRITFGAQFLGQRIDYTYEVAELVPDERFVMRTAEGSMPMETTYTWEDAPEGGTRMQLRNRGSASGFSRMMSPFIKPAMRRANRKDLERLKQILERAAP
jgi:uncharacterized membrane protein